MIYILLVLLIVLLWVLCFYVRSCNKRDINLKNNIKIIEFILEEKYNEKISVRTAWEVDKVIVDVLLQDIKQGKFNFYSLQKYDLSVLSCFPAVFTIYRESVGGEEYKSLIADREQQAINWGRRNSEDSAVLYKEILEVF